MSPKSSRAELVDLRNQVFLRDGYTCKWPGCTYELTPTNPLQLAHLKHRGMGGRTSVNTETDTLTLCRLHHDIFDGRSGVAKLRYELETMLRAQID